MTIGLSYDTSPDQLDAFTAEVKKTIRETTGLTEAHYVFFESFGDSSLNVLLQCFADTTEFAVYMELKEKLMLDVMRVVERQGLEIAFPTQTLYLKKD